MMHVKPKNSCRGLFKICVLASSMRIHIFINELHCEWQEHSQTDSAVCSVDTEKHHFHGPVVIFSCFKKSAYCAAPAFSTIFCLVSEVLWMKSHNAKEHCWRIRIVWKWFIISSEVCTYSIGGEYVCGSVRNIWMYYVNLLFFMWKLQLYYT